MATGQEKWDALSDVQKAKRQLGGAVFSWLTVVLLPLWVPLDNPFKIICALVVGALGLMLAFGAGLHAGSPTPKSRR
jgi:hypothetical protein